MIVTTEPRCSRSLGYPTLVVGHLNEFMFSASALLLGIDDLQLFKDLRSQPIVNNVVRPKSDVARPIARIRREAWPAKAVLRSARSGYPQSARRRVVVPLGR